MFDKNRKYKYIGIAVIAVILVIYAVTNIRIKTVNQHKAEQQSIADAQREYCTDSASQGNGENELTGESRGEDNMAGNSQSGNSQAGNSSDTQSSSEEAAVGIGASSNDDSSSNGLSNSSSSDDDLSNDSSSNNNLSENSSTASTESGNNNSTNESKKIISCTIEIRCDNAAAVKSTISNPGIKALIPDDGVMLKTTTYTGTEGITVYDVLSEVCKLNKLDIVSNPGHSYVMGIGGLKEKMVGKTSGWMYSVNGKAPDYAANIYKVKNGDVILWYYVISD